MSKRKGMTVYENALSDLNFQHLNGLMCIAKITLQVAALKVMEDANNQNQNSIWQLTLDKVKSWFKLPSYNAFRYGMITLYVGTLLMVIGYHNPWMHYSR